jgi:hypothetical protein
MKKLKYEIAIKCGNEEADRLILANVLKIMTQVLKSFAGEISVVGIKQLSVTSGGGNTKKLPKIHPEDQTEYDADKIQRVGEFTAELIGEGYTINNQPGGFAPK